MHCPTNIHWQSVKHLLCYVKQTIHFVLQLHCSKFNSFQAFTDADWFGCRDDRRSTGDSCVFLGNNLISWGCEKQRTVAQSSTRAKYKAFADAAANVIWLRTLLFELGIPISSSLVLWCDNIGTTYLSSNFVFHARTKHIEIDFHLVRDMVADGFLSICFLSSRDQLADIFMKPLSSSKFALLQTKLNVSPILLSLQGHVKDNS